MYRHLPPLNALRAFEAAARHGSFTKAGAELCVTQGAISRQVQKLEQHLGAPLFVREVNTIELTDLGRTILPAATTAFGTIDRAVESAGQGDGVIRLQVAPTFAVRCLMPRLAAFNAKHAAVEVRPSITLHPEAFDPISFDLGIVYGDGRWPSLHAVLLAEEILVPVCAPESIARLGPLNRISGLSKWVLLHTTTDRRDWPRWLAHGGCESVDGYKGPAFETLDMAVRAAEDGIGMALGDLSLIGADIAAGKLVVPFDLPLRTGRGTYLVCSKERRHQQGISIFSEWLLDISPVTQRPDKRP